MSEYWQERWLSYDNWIEHLCELCCEATPAPWKADRNWHVTGPQHDWAKTWGAEGVTLGNYEHQHDQRVCQVHGPGAGNHAAEDFRFIVEARQAIPALIDALNVVHIRESGLHAEVGKLRSAIDTILPRLDDQGLDMTAAFLRQAMGYPTVGEES